MALVLLNEVLENADIVSPSRLRCCISGSSLGAENGMHDSAEVRGRSAAWSRGSGRTSCIVREISVKLSVRLIVIASVLELLLLMHVLLLHVHHVHLLLRRGSGSADD